jgi:hypothetical protein
MNAANAAAADPAKKAAAREALTKALGSLLPKPVPKK